MLKLRELCVSISCMCIGSSSSSNGSNTSPTLNDKLGYIDEQMKKSVSISNVLKELFNIGLRKLWVDIKV